MLQWDLHCRCAPLWDLTVRAREFHFLTVLWDCSKGRGGVNSGTGIRKTRRGATRLSRAVNWESAAVWRSALPDALGLSTTNRVLVVYLLLARNADLERNSRWTGPWFWAVRVVQALEFYKIAESEQCRMKQVRGLSLS